MVDMCHEGIWACAYLKVMCISKEDEATIRDTCGGTMSLIIIITENNSAFLWKETMIMMKVRLDCVLRHYVIAICKLIVENTHNIHIIKFLLYNIFCIAIYSEKKCSQIIFINRVRIENV